MALNPLLVQHLPKSRDLLPRRRTTNHNPKRTWPNSSTTILKKTENMRPQQKLRSSYNPSLLAFLLASSRRAECARCAVWSTTAEASWASCTWSRRACRKLRAWAVRKAPERQGNGRFQKRERERVFSFKKTQKLTGFGFVDVFVFSPIWRGMRRYVESFKVEGMFHLWTNTHPHLWLLTWQSWNDRIFSDWDQRR